MIDLNDFLNPNLRAKSTHKLATFGAKAIPIIASVLDGTAQNRFGISYRAFDEALRCAIVTARIIGPAALPLKDSIAAEMTNENPCIVDEAKLALEMICM